ncbi:MAG: hypothetical protein R8M46_08195 [Ghiorsea sp.]
MRYSRLMLSALVVGLLTLNGCMLTHAINNEESMTMHEDMAMHGMMHADGEEESDMSMEDMQHE